jgi:hypothetical protein
VKEEEMGRACSTKGEKRNAYRVLVGEPEGKRQLGTLGRSWMDNIKLILNRMGWYGLDSSGSGYGPVEGSCEPCNESAGSRERWEILEYLSSLINVTE